MHCKQCDYPLWELAARVCPECGLGFSPTGYAFVVNSVRFMCPHCRQAYYGTGEGGHLVPRRFVCVGCAKGIDEAEMVLAPTEGVSERQTVGGVVPWRVRRERGAFKAYFATMVMVSLTPARLARYCGQEVRALEAWGFAAITVGAGILLSVGMCLGTVVLMDSSQLGVQGTAMDYGMFVWFVVKWLGIVAAGVAAFASVWIVAAHAVLRCLGCARGGLAKTSECFAYAWGASFLAWAPLLGGVMLSPLALIWVIVSASVLLTVRHEAAWWKGTLAAVALPVVGMLGWVVTVFVLSHLKMSGSVP